MEQAAFEKIESGKRTAIGGAMQNLVGGGLANTSLTASVPIVAEKAAAESRLGVTAARESALSNVQMALGNLLFQGTEREKTQQLTAAQNALNREFEAKQKALEREFTSAESRKSEEYKTKETELLRKFTAEQNALNRAAEMAGLRSAQAAQAGQASSLQQFTAGQNALNRAATAEQNALQLAAQYSALNYSPGGAAPDVFGGGVQSFGGGTTTGGGWSSYIGSTGGSLRAPTTGQSWVNGQYIPSAQYPTEPAGGSTIQKAIQQLTSTPLYTFF
jgi:hypothetical protein